MTNSHYAVWILAAGLCTAVSPAFANYVLAEEHRHEGQEPLMSEERKTALIRDSVRFDNPGEMSVLKEHDPELSERVLAISRAGSTVAPGKFSAWVKTRHRADSGKSSWMLFTSSPPQRYMSFVLDGIRFHGFVRLPEYRGISNAQKRNRWKAF